jgi:hypothetical protein
MGVHQQETGQTIDWYAHFAHIFRRANKPETLLVMVQKQVREHRFSFNPDVESYRTAQKSYERLNGRKGAALFSAAHDRFERIKPWNYLHHV